jgi:hypothetical protein
MGANELGLAVARYELAVDILGARLWIDRNHDILQAEID